MRPTKLTGAGTVRKLIHSMNATLDGDIAARGDDIGWGVPSTERCRAFRR